MHYESAKQGDDEEMRNDAYARKAINDAKPHEEFVWAIVTLFLILDTAIVLFVVL